MIKEYCKLNNRFWVLAISHGSYELTKKLFFYWSVRVTYIKMNYYWFNRKEILLKAKEKYSREKTAEYYEQNKEAIKEKAKEHNKHLSQEKKDKIKEYKKKSRIGSI